MKKLKIDDFYSLFMQQKVTIPEVVDKYINNEIEGMSYKPYEEKIREGKLIDTKDFRDNYIERYLVKLFGDIAKHYKSETFDTTEPEVNNAINKLRDYITNWKANMNNNKSILIIGDVGTGKNHIVTIFVRSLLQRILTQDRFNKFYAKHKDIPKEKVDEAVKKDIGIIRFTSIPNLRFEVEETFKSENTRLEIIKKYSRCNLLILDELGNDKGTEYFNEIVFSIMDGRYSARKPCILISNYDKGKLIQVYGRPLVDRYYNPNNLRLEFNFESYRQRRS